MLELVNQKLEKLSIKKELKPDNQKLLKEKDHSNIFSSTNSNAKSSKNSRVGANAKPHGVTKTTKSKKTAISKAKAVKGSDYASKCSDLEDNITPNKSTLIKFKNSEGENSKVTEQMFDSKEDFEFIVQQAPKLLKNLLFKHNGWTSYNERPKKNYHYYSQPKKMSKDPKVHDLIMEKYDKLLKDKAFSTNFTTEFNKDWLLR